MKILYASSEATPYAKSGGLADVAGSLPKALVNDGIDCRVVMPLYGDIKIRDGLTYVTNFSVPVGWRSQYCGLFKAEYNGVTYYFIDNEYYFKRSGLYGFYDDGERFAFFARAILEMLFYTDFEPDIINCNDWQTALTPVYLNLYYRHLDKFSRIKTVFTIHNIAYQGKYGLDILEDTCGIGARDAHVVEYDGCANFMKGAIETADKVTTVSPTYAGEILDPGSGEPAGPEAGETPDSGEAEDPNTGEATDAGDVTDPDTGEVPNPGEAADPSTGESDEPGGSGAADPGVDETGDPGTGDTADPGAADDSEPPAWLG